MGIYAEAVQKLYVAYFNRPADALGLIYWEEQITKNGGSAAAVANAFSASQEYKDLYAGKDSANIVNAIYQNLFGRAAETDGLLYWGSRLENKTFDIGTIAMAILNGAQNDDKKVIDNKTAAAVEFTKALDTTAEIVAYSGNAANAVAKAWLATVTATADSLTAAKASVNSTITSIGSGTVANGQTFTLTTGIDTLTGTNNNDVFLTDNNAASAADSINGGAGTDTLKLVGTTTVPSISNIEHIVLSNPAASFNAANIAGVTSLAVESELMAAARTYTVNANQSLSLKSITGTANVLNVAAASSVTANTITLDAVGDVATGGTAAGIEIAGTGVKTLNLTTANNASRISLVDATTTGDFAVETINIAGDKNLTASVAASSGAKVTVAAGNFTGALNLDLSATEVFEVTAGSGNDRVNFGGQFTNADKFNGGAGTDTLATSTSTVNAAFAAIVDAKTNGVAHIAGVDVLEYTGTAAYALDASVIQTTGITSYTTTSAITGAVGSVGVAVTGQSNAQTFSIEAAVTGGAGAAAAAASGLAGSAGSAAVTFAPTVNNGANALNLSLKGVTLTGGAGGAGDGAGAQGAGGTALDVSNFETINITSTGATATAVNTLTGGAGATAGATLVASANATFNISGANEINLGTIANGNQPVTINAAALAGKLTVATGTGADVITGGSGVNVITLAGGADTINLSASVAKADTITFTGATATSGTALVSITGFTNATTTGDKLDTAIGTVTIQADVASGTATGVANLTAGVTNGIMSFGGTAAATATLTDKITAATAAAFAGAVNEVLAFEHSGKTYVFAQVGTANAFDAGTDQIVELVGITGLTSLSTTASGTNALFIA